MRFHKPVAAALAFSAIAGLAACGGSDDTDAKPVAKIDSLSGQSTSVTLAPSFVAGLTSLKLTPAALLP
jgi:hypothetical protein